MTKIFIDPSCKILCMHISTLKETSYDKANDCSMVEDEKNQVVNFDDYMQQNYSLLKTNDALFWTDSQYKSMMFVEFKNGDYKEKDLRLKCYDSIIMLSKILGLSINQLSGIISYTLVHNDPRNSIQKNIVDRSNITISSRMKHILPSFSEMVGSLLYNIEVLTSDEFELKYL